MTSYTGWYRPSFSWTEANTSPVFVMVSWPFCGMLCWVTVTTDSLPSIVKGTGSLDNTYP